MKLELLSLLVLLIPVFAILWHQRRERRKAKHSLVVDLEASMRDNAPVTVANPQEDRLDWRNWPTIPKDPEGRTLTGVHVPARRWPSGAKNMEEMYRRARWKCERCGKMNEWGTPTCPCVSGRGRRR